MVHISVYITVTDPFLRKRLRKAHHVCAVNIKTSTLLTNA